MDVMDDFPIGTTGGGDFLTGLPVREIAVTTPGGGTDTRRERVVMTQRVFEYGDPPPPPGRVGFSELTIREMGRLVGMVPEGVVNEMKAKVARLENERDELSETLAAVLRENETVRDRTDVRVIYVAPDGTEHGSKGALMGHINRKAVA